MVKPERPNIFEKFENNLQITASVLHNRHWDTNGTRSFIEIRKRAPALVEYRQCSKVYSSWFTKE